MLKVLIPLAPLLLISSSVGGLVSSDDAAWIFVTFESIGCFVLKARNRIILLEVSIAFGYHMIYIATKNYYGLDLVVLILLS